MLLKIAGFCSRTTPARSGGTAFESFPVRKMERYAASLQRMRDLEPRPTAAQVQVKNGMAWRFRLQEVEGCVFVRTGIEHRGSRVAKRRGGVADEIVVVLHDEHAAARQVWRSVISSIPPNTVVGDGASVSRMLSPSLSGNSMRQRAPPGSVLILPLPPSS